MDLVHGTPMTFGFLTWPLRPPAVSMVLVVKATFDIVDRGFATLSAKQAQCHGPVFFDDDPEQSPRLPSDFAVLKPAGECVVAGRCHPPDAPAPMSVVAFSVGPIQKAVGVFGDRRWSGGLLGKKPSAPAPFESMSLRWERAFGGARDARNPLGVGRDDVDGEVPLPNLEDPRRPIGGPSDAPAPVAFGPIPPTWAARLAHAGTYDRAWAEARFPYLPVDFDPDFYFEAPPDQRLRRRYWTGREEIALRHLLKGRPFVTTHLPGVRPRGFVTRASGRFEEVPLVLDTIVVDGEAERVTATWRGAIDVADEKLSDVARLFLMHDLVDSGRSVAACAERLEAHLRLRQLERSGFTPENPEEDEEARTIALRKLERTLGGDPRTSQLLQRAIAGATVVGGPPSMDEAEEPPPPLPEQPDPEPLPDADAVLDEMFLSLADQGLDVAAIRAKAMEEAGKDAPQEPPKKEEVAAIFERAGVEMPDEVAEVLDELEALREAEVSAEEAVAEERDDPRARFLAAHAAGRPIDGDFSGVDLRGEDLSGVVVKEGALLSRADLTGCVLREATLDGVALIEARLDRADLEGASLAGADLTRASLTECRLDGATLDGATLDDAKLARARLVGASLIEVEGARVDLRETWLEGATLDGADLSRAWLAGANLARASLVEARLGGCFAQNADFTEATLTKLRASFGARFDNAVLRGAKAAGARFREVIAPAANFSFADLTGADFAMGQLVGATFAGCVLRGATFVEANLSGAAIQKSDLMRANLLAANLEDADLRGSSFYGAELFRARVRGAQLELADLAGTKLEGRA